VTSSPPASATRTRRYAGGLSGHAPRASTASAGVVRVTCTVTATGDPHALTRLRRAIMSPSVDDTLNGQAEASAGDLGREREERSGAETT
jgi:hypothetical protein